MGGERRMNTSFYLLVGGKNKAEKQNTASLQWHIAHYCTFGWFRQQGADATMAKTDNRTPH
jgi:hypothetical protein